MTHLPFESRLTRPFAAPLRANRIAVLYAVALVAGSVGVATSIAPGGAADGAEWQLTLLLRFMAGIKALMVVGALGLAHWRFLRPVSAPPAAGYCAAIGLMAGAPGLIWSMQHIALGAACFHVGLLVYLGLAWRDGAARPPAKRA